LTACRNHPETSFVDDRAGLLKTGQILDLENYHHLLLRDLNIHFQLTILAESPDDPDRKAVELFDTLGLDETTGGARGGLLLVDPVGKQVRLEIGYDLEGTFPDGFVAYLEREQMAPLFAAGRVGDGIEATVELLVGRALGEVPADFQGGKVELKHLSGGAGARSPMPIGEEIQTKPVVENEEDFAAQPSPRQTLERYLEVLQQHVKDPDLGIYTPESRNFFRKWLATDAQQNNECKELEKNLPQAEERISGDLAVLRFPINNRRASPYLFRRAAEGWQLDILTMSRLIGFNHKNQWFFRTPNHEFMFAFDDVGFDRNGYPH